MTNKDTTITVATGLYPPDIGGPATYSKLLFDRLPGYGVRVRVVSFGLVRWLPKGLRHIVFFFFVLVRSFGSRLIFAQDPVSVGLPSLWVSKVLRKPFYLKVVGDYAWEQMQNQRSKIKNKNFVTPEEFQKNTYDKMTERRRAVEHKVAQSADKIIVPSNYLKGVVSGWGVDSTKIHVIYNAFEGTDDVGTREVLRQFLNFDGKLIMSVGRLEPWKGFGTLIDCMPNILSKFPKTKLFIVGDGSEEKNLKLKIKNLKLEEDVVLTGRLDRPTLMNYLAASDLFVLNTGYEGLSHQLLEVMSLGIPIVTTNAGGNTETIEDGKTGLLVQYGDNTALCSSINRLLGDSRLSEALRSNAKKNVKKFNVEAMLSRTAEVLQSV